MTKTMVKRLALIVCVLLIAAFAVACNPTENDEDSGGQSIPLTGATITAKVDDVVVEGPSGSISVEVVQGQQLVLIANNPSGAPTEYTTVEREWLRGTYVALAGTQDTYSPDVTNIGAFNVTVRTRYKQGDTSNVTDWAEAIASITVVAPELPSYDAPTNVVVVHNDIAQSELPIHLAIGDTAMIGLTHSSQQELNYEYRWLNNDSVVNGASPIYTYTATVAGMDQLRGQVRVEASETNSASMWASAIANITTYGVAVTPTNPEVWINAPQPFTAALQPSAQDVEWEWTLQDINGNPNPQGFGISTDGVLTLDSGESQPAHGTKVYVVATAVVNGVTVSGRSIATVIDPDIDTPFPELNNVTLSLFEGGVEGETVVPGTNISVNAYQDQQLIFRVGYDELQQDEDVEIMIDTNGTATDWLSETYFVRTFGDQVNNNIKVYVRSWIEVNGELIYSQVIELTATITIVDTTPVEPGEVPDAPTGVLVSWVSGGREGGIDGNANQKPGTNKRFIAYRNQDLKLRILHDALPNGVGVELSFIYTGWLSDWTTNLDWERQHNDLASITVIFRVRTYVDVGGQHLASESVEVRALIDVEPLPILDSPTGVKLTFSDNVESNDGKWYVDGETFESTLVWDRVDGLDYEWFWSFSGIGNDSSLETVTWYNSDSERTLFVSIRAVLKDADGNIINASSYVEIRTVLVGVSN
jgi:hypothetical protein